MLPRYVPPITPAELRDVLCAPVNNDAVSLATSRLAKLIGRSPDDIFLIDQGRIALALALRIADCVPGDEILIPSFICSVVADTVIDRGLRPILLDVSASDLSFDEKDLERYTTPRTKAILFVNYFGMPNPSIAAVRRFADARKLLVLEDCAHAFGSSQDGRSVGTFGDIAFFSFNTDKPVTAGQGGALVINKEELRPRARDLVRNLPRTAIATERDILLALLIQLIRMDRSVYTGYVSMEFGKKIVATDSSLKKLAESVVLGKEDLTQLQDTLIKKTTGVLYKLKNKLLRSTVHNEKNTQITTMNSLRASLLLKQLDSSDTILKEQKEKYQLFFSLLSDRQCLLRLPDPEKTAFFRLPVIFPPEKQAFFISKGEQAGFEFGNYNWPGGIHKYPPLCSDRSFPNTEKLTGGLINLPIHIRTNTEDIKKMVSLLQ